MSIPLWVSRSEIYDEFSNEEAEKYFSLKQKKFIADIDNYYYTVSLREDYDDLKKGLVEKFVSELEKLREKFDYKSQDKLDFMGLDYYPFGLKFYNNRLSLNECFDILICNTLPNNKTPRILVQLRARYLWHEGTKKCIKKSFKYLEKILKKFKLNADRVRVNRVDYAFHNNAVQNPAEYFDRETLNKYCATRSRIYNMVGDPLQNWSIDYLSIGSRNSKSVFFRFYNKTREVVEQNYKSFFIDIWLDNGLISEYDKFCLERAFVRKSYDVGLCIGRIEWYLKYGHNEQIKDKIKNILKTCYYDNDNSTALKKALSGVLPEVTVISNIEYETHTDFYRSFDKSISQLNVSTDTTDKLFYVLQIYECRKSYIDYLTSYGNVVAFMQDVKAIPDRLKSERKKFTSCKNGKSHFDKEGYNAWKEKYIKSQYLDFWKRLRRAKLGTSYKPELKRAYTRNIDIARLKNKLLSDVATLSIYQNGLNNDFSVNTDLSQVVSFLNDNDMHKALTFLDVENGCLTEIENADYDPNKKRKNRHLKGVLSSPGKR